MNNGGFNKWLEILGGEDLPTKLRKSENVDLKFSVRRHSEDNAVNKRQRLQRAQICSEAATKFSNYTANETDEEKEHRLLTGLNKMRSIEFATKVPMRRGNAGSVQSKLSSSIQP